MGRWVCWVQRPFVPILTTRQETTSSWVFYTYLGPSMGCLISRDRISSWEKSPSSRSHAGLSPRPEETNHITNSVAKLSILISVVNIWDRWWMDGWMNAWKHGPISDLASFWEISSFWSPTARRGFACRSCNIFHHDSASGPWHFAMSSRSRHNGYAIKAWTPSTNQRNMSNIWEFKSVESQTMLSWHIYKPNQVLDLVTMCIVQHK